MKQQSIAVQIALPGIVISLIVSVALFFVISQQQQELAVNQARRTALSIATQVAADRSIYASQVIGKIKKEAKDGGVSWASNYEDIKGAIPLPATFVHRTSEAVNSGGGTHTVDLLSLWNINPTRGARNDFETKGLRAVADDPSHVEDEVVIEGDSITYRAVTADVANAQSCVDCHNIHPKSAKKDFNKGDVMGGLVITMPMKEEYSVAKKNAVVLTGGLLVAFLLLLGLQWLFVNRPLVKAISDLESAADRISKGDVGAALSTDRGDELGRLTKAFERMRASIAAAMDQAGGDDDDDGL